MKFIFATTEAHKLPDTILSRCQRHNFRRIPAARMLERLKQICAAEKVTLSDRSLSLVVRQSEGGMRDALSLVDQIISACGDAPTDEAVAEALGTVDRTMVHGFAEALVRRDTGALLRLVDEAFNRGVDLKRLAEEIAFQLRHVFVAKATGAAPSELAESDQQAVQALAREADVAQLTRIFDIVHGAIWELGRAAQPRLTLEMTLLKAVQLAPAASIPELIATVEKLAGGGPAVSKKSGTVPAGDSPQPSGAPGGRSAPGPFRA